MKNQARRTMLQMSAALAAGALLPGRVVQAASDPKIIEAAKKEGSVSLYSSASTGPSNALAEAFRKKYDINVSVYRAGSADVATRVKAEESAGRTQADALIIEEPALSLLAPFLANYDSPERKAIDAAYRLPNSTLIRMYMSQLGWNTNVVKGGAAPGDWKDLLDPKWKGKLVTAHPGYSGVIATHVLALVHLHGWDYFKQLAQNKPMLVQSAVDPSGVVASGERPIAANGGDYTFYQVKKKGNPVEIVFPKEGVPLVVSPSAITSFAPHPNAARLFTDFIFSRDLQQVLADSEGLYTGHPDVKYPADRPKLSELNLLRVDPEELEKRNEEIKTRFVEFFGA